MLLVLPLLLAGCGSDDGDRRAVVLVPAEDVSADVLDEVAEVLHDRLEELGVDDPSVEVEGGELHVAAPGREIDAAIRPGELHFRPVLEERPPLDVGDAGLARPNEAAVLPDTDGTISYALGPDAGVGRPEHAEAGAPHDHWVVDLTVTEDGIVAFNELAGRCFERDTTCPTGQVALVLDGVVHSAPSIQTPSFERDQIQIFGSFTERDAKDLAAVLWADALPVTLERRTP